MRPCTPNSPFIFPLICLYVLNATAWLLYSHRCQKTQLYCHGSFTGYVSWSESSSVCVFWHTIMCTAQHQRT